METNPLPQLAPSHTTKWWHVILSVTWFKTRTPTMQWKCYKPNSKVLLQRWRIVLLHCQVVQPNWSILGISRSNSLYWFDGWNNVCDCFKSHTNGARVCFQIPLSKFFVSRIKCFRIIKAILKILTCTVLFISPASSCKEHYEKYK